MTTSELIEIVSGFENDTLKAKAERDLSAHGYSYPEILTARYFGFDNVVKNSDSGDFIEISVATIRRIADRIEDDYKVSISNEKLLAASKKLLFIDTIAMRNSDSLDFHDVSRFGATEFVKALIGEAKA